MLLHQPVALIVGFVYYTRINTADRLETRHMVWSKSTRRSFFLVVGAASGGALAGCLADDEERLPDPIAIEDDHSCPVCNMVIVNHPGPAGHAFYPDDSELPEPDIQDGVVPYCASTCAYNYYFEYEERGDEPRVIYLTDYSKVDWEVYEDGNEYYITAHFEEDVHTDARDLTFVVDSEALGAMGQSVIGFSDTGDAESFAEEYGGDLYDHDSIDRELIESLGFV